MLRSIAARIASVPFFYDLIQRAAGEKAIVEELRKSLARLAPRTVLDVGSAGGRMSRLAGARPVCLDLDIVPLHAMRTRGGRGAVAGNAVALPFADRSFDVALLVGVSHHLDDKAFGATLAELRRVVKDSLIFLDGLRNDDHLVSRLMWRYDRGSHPRTESELIAALKKDFDIDEPTVFAVYKSYLICAGRPRH